MCNIKAMYALNLKSIMRFIFQELYVEGVGN